MGVLLGDALCVILGEKLGLLLGAWLGVRVGWLVGFLVGVLLGDLEGWPVGFLVGVLLGEAVGLEVSGATLKAASIFLVARIRPRQFYSIVIIEARAIGSTTQQQACE